MSVKISEMTATTTLANDDIIPVVDISAGTSGSKKITIANLINTLSANTTTGTTFDSTDVLNLSDPSTGETIKITVADFIKQLSVNTSIATTCDINDVVSISDSSTGSTIKITLQDLMDAIMAGSDTVTELDSSSKVFVIDDTGKFVSINLSDFSYSANYSTSDYRGWCKLPITLTCCYNKAIDSSGSIVTVSSWNASTSYNIGDFIYDPVGLNSMYKCIKSGTSGTSTPSFSTTFGIVQEDVSGPWWESMLFTVYESNTSISGMNIGVPLRLGDVGISLIKSISGNYIGLSSGITYTATPYSLIYIGDWSKVRQYEFFFDGIYSTISSSEGLFDLYKRGFVWRGPAGSIVEYSIKNYANDTTGINYINITNDGSLINWRNSSKGTAVDTTWIVSDESASPIATGILQYGNVIEIVKDSDGSTNQDATDLSVSMTIITN